LKPVAVWARPFDDPILLPGGREIVTLRDAGDYIISLPKAEQHLAEMAVIAAEWRAVRRVFGCRRDLRSCVSLIMWTGDAYRPFLHDLHFNAAWSFQIAVVRAPRPYLRYSHSRMAQTCGWRFDPTNAA
jgi:hypothetical protein